MEQLRMLQFVLFYKDKGPIWTPQCICGNKYGEIVIWKMFSRHWDVFRTSIIFLPWDSLKLYCVHKKNWNSDGGVWLWKCGALSDILACWGSSKFFICISGHWYCNFPLNLLGQQISRRLERVFLFNFSSKMPKRLLKFCVEKLNWHQALPFSELWFFKSYVFGLLVWSVELIIFIQLNIFSLLYV